MQKFLAVVRHEYKKIVYKWSFLIATLVFPLLAAAFAFVPALIFSVKSEPTRIVVVDPTGKIAPRIETNLAKDKIQNDEEEDLSPAEAMQSSRGEQMKKSGKLMSGGFIFEKYQTTGKSPEQISGELLEEITQDKIDAYLIVPTEYDSPNAQFEFNSRKAGDEFASKSLSQAVNAAVRSQRLADAKIDEKQLENLSKNIKMSVKKLDEKGNLKDNDGIMILSFLIGFMIYLTLLLYGQQILAAVVEEKETRIAEILFSSAKPFELMMGKIVGVCLAGLTQIAIWILSLAILVGAGAAAYSASLMDFTFPNIPLLAVVCFLVYFLLGFFIYATIYALIGSMVTTVQEGGQFAMFPVGLLLIGFYLSFAVIRDPNSTLAFWASIAPFFAPLAMPVRIVSEMPPLWQIGVSIAVNALTIAFLVWLAARVYRVGMLMYGKRATIPEVWKWIRQS